MTSPSVVKVLSVSSLRVSDVFAFPPSVHPQRLGGQKRPRDGRQRYEDRRLRPRQRRAQYRLLQKDHQRESPGSLCPENNADSSFWL